MRLPAYGKALLKQREAGKMPWVVVVALGSIIDAQVLRGQEGVARIGLPFDFPLESGDLALLRGLDVVASCFAPESVSAHDARIMHNRALEAIIDRGEPGLIWCANERGDSASPIEFMRSGRMSDFAVMRQTDLPLDRSFRENFAWWRKCALLGELGIFANPAFNPVRERVRRELLSGRVTH